MPSTALALTSQAPVPAKSEDDYADVPKLRKQYLDYLSVKRAEIDEAQQSRHYYHGDQWTAEQIKELKRRKQPVITSNRVGRKIDAVVGLVEKQRQDPKAYPRTPQHEEGAEVATAAIRYVLDSNEWRSKSPECGRDAGIEGKGGMELNIVPGDQGDPDITLDIIDPDLFFYDPRSYREDFSDCRFMGVAKWIDVDLAKEMFPDKEEQLAGLMDGSSDFGADADRERKWIDSENKKLRLIDHWYMHKGEWCWCIYASNEKLMEGQSPHIDEKDKTFPRYIMFSAAVDHDGDRYGFVRNLKPIQDELNQRRSKALHVANTRRLITKAGNHGDDGIERMRREMIRPDGVIEYNIEKPEFDDQRSMLDMGAQLKFLEEAKNEIETFGPNTALEGRGQGIEGNSGRAIALLQQAGIAELGPFIIAYRSWKIRVYRAIWNTVQRHWKAERWIRVTDDEGVAQFIQVNGVGIDPQTRLPAIINGLGSLDVDIILDEGPDTVNMQADAFDTLSVLASKGAQVPPALLIELAPVQSSVKKKYLDEMKQKQGQPPPEVQAAQVQQQIDRESAQTKLQIDGEAQAAKLKQQREDNAAQIQLKRDIAAADADLERDKAKAAIETERQKNRMQIQIERERGLMKLELEERLGELKIEQQERLSQNEANTRTAERQHAQTTQNDGSNQTAKVMGELGKLIAKTGEATVKATTAPREITVKRTGGEVTGATSKVDA